MNDELYNELYDLGQCGEWSTLSKEMSNFSKENILEFLKRFIVDYYECAMQITVPKDCETIVKIANEVQQNSKSIQDIVNWLSGETEEPDLENYFDDIEKELDKEAKALGLD